MNGEIERYGGFVRLKVDGVERLRVNDGECKSDGV